jgi:hypothetical protein
MESEKIICWEKPQRAMSVADWKNISADSAPPGVYTPNMSKEDQLKWKGKIIGTDKPRVEVRKTFHTKNHFAHVLFTFAPFEDESFIISTNGKISFSDKEFGELPKVLLEVGMVLHELVDKIEMKLREKNKDNTFDNLNDSK